MSNHTDVLIRTSTRYRYTLTGSWIHIKSHDGGVNRSLEYRDRAEALQVFTDLCAAQKAMGGLI